jgi:tetratricopeptide (TPR) repeat protein
LARLAGTTYAASMDERDRLSREALELARRSGDPAALRDALGARWWATLGPDRVAERHALADEIERLAAAQGNDVVALMALECRLGAQLIEGRMADADASVRAYAQLAEKVRQPAIRFLSCVIRGSRALDSGRFAEAEALFGRALEVGRGKVPFADIMYGGQMNWLSLMRGGAFQDQVAGFLRSASPRYAGADHLVSAALAYVAAGAGQRDGALRAYRALAADDFASLERDEHWLLTAALICEVTCYLADARGAEALYAQLAPYAHLFVVHDLIRATSGSVHSLLGELAAELGRFDVALAHYETALTREAAEGVRPSLLATQASLARCLVRRGGPKDVRRAELLMKEVERGCAEIGSLAFGRYRERMRAVRARRG